MRPTKKTTRKKTGRKTVKGPVPNTPLQDLALAAGPMIDKANQVLNDMAQSPPIMRPGVGAYKPLGDRKAPDVAPGYALVGVVYSIPELQRLSLALDRVRDLPEVIRVLGGKG